jgi:hypothetical protein
MFSLRRFLVVTRVEHDPAPLPRGLAVWCNEPPTRKDHLMARNSQGPAPATAREPKALDVIAWHVSNPGDKAFWSKVGAA